MGGLSHVWSGGALTVARTLEREGAETRIVGGPVRDALLGISPKDVDLCTDASPTRMLRAAATAGIRTFPSLEEVEADPRLFERGGLRHGTVSFVVAGEVFEATSLRGKVSPDGLNRTLAFGASFEEDAGGRDFTVNAMSVDRGGTVHDFFGGMGDLRSGTVRFVGSADDRIREDPQRILRYFRFRGRLTGPGTQRDVHRETLAALARNASALTRVSGERVWQEMSKILASPAHLASTLDDMAASGVAASLGLAWIDGAPRRAAGAALRGAPPEIVLGLLTAHAPGNELARAWKMSRRSAALVELTRNHAHMAAAPFASFIELAMRPRTDRADVASLLDAFGRPGDARRVRAPLPEFPLRGADLVDAGYPSGPELGAALERLREAWKASGYLIGRDDLLAEVSPPSVAPRR